jgi:hypothetical protein
VLISTDIAGIVTQRQLFWQIPYGRAQTAITVLEPIEIAHISGRLI